MAPVTWPIKRAETPRAPITKPAASKVTRIRAWVPAAWYSVLTTRWSSEGSMGPAPVPAWASGRTPLRGPRASLRRLSTAARMLCCWACFTRCASLPRQPATTSLGFFSSMQQRSASCLGPLQSLPSLCGCWTGTAASWASWRAASSSQRCRSSLWRRCCSTNASISWNRM